MPDGTESAPASRKRELEAQLEALRTELWKVGYSIGMPTYDAQTKRNNQMAGLQRKIEALQSELSNFPPGPTGEEYGIVAIHSVLGDRLVRAPERDQPEYDYDPANPFERFAHEMGWSTK
jgi:hypothetical protein